MAKLRIALTVTSAIVVAATLLAASLVLPQIVRSSPPNQDRIVDLGPGAVFEDVYETMNEYASYTYRVNVPPGSNLAVWVGTEPQGGCYWYAALRELDGTWIDNTYVGPEPDTWSEPVEATIGSGSVLVEVGGDTGCNAGLTYPVSAYVYMEVSGTPPPQETTPPPPQTTIDFWADQYSIQKGQCTTLRWTVAGVQAVYYSGQGVPGSGERTECPQQTTTYELRVITDSGEEIRTITIVVDEPTDVPITDTPRPSDTPHATDTPRSTTTPSPTQRATTTPSATPDECPDYYEPNDHQRQAWVISEDTINLGAYICTAEDADYFAIPVEDGEDVEIVLTDLPGNYDLEFYTSYEEDLLAGSYHAGTQDDRVTRSDLDEGVYLVKVFSPGGDFSPDLPYTLSIRRTTSPTPTWRPTPTRTPSPTPTPPPGPPILVVTHAGALNTQVGRSDGWPTIDGWIRARYDRVEVLDLDAEGVSRTSFSAIDGAIEARFGTLTPRPEYILIIGGPAVVNFGQVTNPTSDRDTIYTDDLYGDFDHDGLNFPEIPVARLPDGGSFQVYETQFSMDEGRSQGNWGQSLAFGHALRPYVETIANLIGKSAILSPDFTAGTYNWLMGGRNGYFILHGSDGDTSQWWGDNGDKTVANPVAWNVAAARAWPYPGTIVSEACYGAFIGTSGSPRAVGDSIALTFLLDGEEAVIGSTTVTYSYNRRVLALDQCTNSVCTFKTDVEWPVTDGVQHLSWEIFSRMRNGAHPLTAYSQAKRALADSLGPGGARNTELKALHSFVYYGLPPSR